VKENGVATRATVTTPSTSLDKWITWLSRPPVTAAVGLLLVLLLIGAGYLDGLLAGPFNSRLWRDGLSGPILIVYILLTWRLLRRFGNQASEAFRPLMAMNHDDFDQLLAEASPYDRRREWLALGIGAAFGLLVAYLSNGPEHFWAKLYGLLGSILMFGLLGWLIYRSLAYTRLLTELHCQPLDIDIFDPTPLEPVAHFSLVTSLAFIGGITLSVLLNPDPQDLLSIHGILIYGILIPVPVLVFFLIMMSTHNVMAEAKEGELKLVRRNLSAAYKEWKERNAEGKLQDMEALSYAITAGLAYEKRIEEAPEWPYTTGTLRNLIVSTLLPVAAWLAQMVVELIT
jgi:hypothetical protein